MPFTSVGEAFYWSSEISTSGKNQNLRKIISKENVLICHLFWKEKYFHNENEALLLYHWNWLFFTRKKKKKKGYLEMKWILVLSAAHWHFFFFSFLILFLFIFFFYSTRSKIPEDQRPSCVHVCCIGSSMSFTGMCVRHRFCTLKDITLLHHNRSGLTFLRVCKTIHLLCKIHDLWHMMCS